MLGILTFGCAPAVSRRAEKQSHSSFQLRKNEAVREPKGLPMMKNASWEVWDMMWDMI